MQMQKLSDENLGQFITIPELARRLGVSTDTVKRKMRAGRLTDIKFVDLFQDGKLRADVNSIESFITSRHAAAQKIYSQPHPNSRP